MRYQTDPKSYWLERREWLLQQWNDWQGAARTQAEIKKQVEICEKWIKKLDAEEMNDIIRI